MFGKQAQADLPYVECFPQGWRKVIPSPVLCHALSSVLMFLSAPIQFLILACSSAWHAVPLLAELS